MGQLRSAKRDCRCLPGSWTGLVRRLKSCLTHPGTEYTIIGQFLRQDGFRPSPPAELRPPFQRNGTKEKESRQRRWRKEVHSISLIGSALRAYRSPTMWK